MSDASADARIDHLQSTLDITNALLLAVSTTSPFRSLVSRMSVICRGSAIVYDAEGTVVASAGEAPSQLIWNEASSTNVSELEFDVGRWFVRTRRVALNQGVHVLAIASRNSEIISNLGELLLETAERMLSVVHGIQHGASFRDQRDNERLLASIHDGILPSREHRIWSRASPFGFQSYSPVRAIELSPLHNENADESQITQLFAQARASGMPLLIMLRRADLDSPATIAGLLPDSREAEQWIATLTDRFLVGVSASISALTGVPDCVREAETALGIALNWRKASPDGTFLQPVYIDRIDLSTWLLSHTNTRQLNERITQTLAPIKAPQLRETLIAFLASDQNIARTATALFVHPNTVRYRLERIEAALGKPIASAPVLANLVLALYPEIRAYSLSLANAK